MNYFYLALSTSWEEAYPATQFVDNIEAKLMEGIIPFVGFALAGLAGLMVIRAFGARF